MDVYGVGAILWVLLTGEQSAAGERLAKITELRDGVPEPVALGIDLALEPTVSARRISCQQLEQRLERALDGGSDPVELRSTMEGFRDQAFAAGASSPPALEPSEEDSEDEVEPLPPTLPRRGAPGGLAAPIDSEEQVTIPAPRSEPPKGHQPGPESLPAVGDDSVVERISSLFDGIEPEQSELKPGDGEPEGEAPEPVPSEPEGEDTPAEAGSSTPAAAVHQAPSGPPAGETAATRRGVSPLVAALLALIVGAAGFAAAWLLKPSGASTSLPASTAPTTKGSPAAPSGSAPTPAPSAEPTSGLDVGAADASAAEAAPDAGGDGSELLSYEGYLTVQSRVTADVYVQGIVVGPTNRKNKSRCQQRFIRLRDSASGKWLTSGEAVRIACMSATTVTIDPPAP